MSSAITTLRPASQGAPPRAEVNYLNVAYGVTSWLLTTDHKRIAILYLVSVTLMFFLGGAAATVDPPQPDDARRASWSTADTYNKLFTDARHHHGVLLPGAGDADRAGQLPPAA